MGRKEADAVCRKARGRSWRSYVGGHGVGQCCQVGWRRPQEGLGPALSLASRGGVRPQVRGVAAEATEGGPGDQVALVVVGVGYGGMSGDEALG